MEEVVKMNKKKKIIIGVLALVLVMVVGFALFSDTLTINGTATAKGDFELTTSCDDDVNNALGVNGPQEQGSVTDSNISCSGKNVNISATLGYPGSYKYYRVKVTNTGMIPAELEKIVELNDPDWYTFSKENNPGVIENCEGTSDNEVCARLFSSLTWLDDYASTDDDMFDTSWYQEQLDAVLDPGETAYFYVLLEWLSSSNTQGEELVATLNAEITWNQVTN